MKNIHPRVVELLSKQLPNGAQITGAVSVSETESTVLVKIGNAKNQFNLPKSDIGYRYPQGATTLTVTQDCTYRTAMQKLSDRDRLFLLPGVDFENANTPLEFDANGKGETALVILDDSIMYTGSLKVNLVLSDKVLATNPTPFSLPLNYERVALALVRKVFTVKGNVFTGNQLTKAFCQNIIEYLNSFNFSLYKDALTQMQQGEVLSVHNDGVSDILTLRSLSGICYLIRFKTHDGDAPVL
ncbi:hypothetical protein AVA65_08155 [Salmonella enterica subsp. enterica serovar Minnesota]|nr:hypothetical protein [Salmonella enterica subsp. enterica serovar Minnesota]